MVRSRPESYNTVCPPRAVTRQGALMSITPNFCCDETKNRGAYTRLTLPFCLISFLPQSSKKYEKAAAFPRLLPAQTQALWAGCASDPERAQVESPPGPGWGPRPGAR